MRRGFTLVEMLVAMAVLSIVMLLLLAMVQTTGRVWSTTSAKADAFKNARAAFETLTSMLRQATLATYFDYYDRNALPRTVANSATFTPVAYGRTSQLHFVAGPQLVPGAAEPVSGTHGVFFFSPQGFSEEPTYQGLNSLLNATGFYIAFNSDADTASAGPSFIPDRRRFRLMQFVQPAEDTTIYDSTAPPNAWFQAPLSSPSTSARVVGDNIIALIVQPMRSAVDEDPGSTSFTASDLIAPDYRFDSRNTAGTRSSRYSDWTAPATSPQPYPLNQMPPLIKVTMVAVDEPSFARLQAQSGGGGAPSEITSALSGRFQSVTSYAADLAALEQALIDAKLQYRVFSAIIPVRSARFSGQ